MNRKPFRMKRRGQGGATLIEVLVALFILMVGLLGLVGVMIQSQRSQLESYQRLQALLLVQDMASRINANQGAALCYEQAATFGTGYTATPDASACASGNVDQKSRVTKDLIAWNDLLKGSAEVSGGNKVGGILGARGCITRDATSGIFQVSVAWQATEGGGAPAAGITCGNDPANYGGEAFRRAVSITVLPANT
jgi:type IV pilus assembly protein PilV